MLLKFAVVFLRSSGQYLGAYNYCNLPKSASHIRGASGKGGQSLVVVLVVLGVVFSILVAVVACHYFYYH